MTNEEACYERCVGPSLARRIVITLLLPTLLVVASRWLTLPGVDRNAFEALLGRGPLADLYGGLSFYNVSVFALGVTPILTAYGLVELIAIIVPRWRRLRHVDPAGRAKIERVSRAVALALAAFQGFGVAKSLEALSGATIGGGDVLHVVGIRTTVMIVGSLVAGVCVTFLVAELVSRQAIANGLIVILLVEEINASWTSVGRNMIERLRLQELAPMAILGGLVVIGVAIAASWLALRGENSGAERAGHLGYRGSARTLAVRPWIPIPASALAPIPIASFLLILPTTLALLFRVEDAWSFQHTNTWTWLAANLTVTLALALFFGRLIHRPRDMADIATRLGAGSKKELEIEAHSALGRALVPTMLFLSTLLIARSAGAALPLSGISITILPIATAVVMDAARAMRSLRIAPDDVSVWTERRISVVPVLRAVLEAEGITVRTRGDAVLSLLQVFGPYAAVDILVREADARRASEVLRHLLLGGEAPKREPLAAEGSSPSPAPTPPPSGRQRTVGLVMTAAIAGAILALTTVRIPHRAATTEARARPNLEIVMVADDGIDPFERMNDSDLPERIELRTESAPVGLDAYGQQRIAKRGYAISKLHPTESLDAVARRLEGWLATLPTPPGTRFALEATEDYDADMGKATVDGYRSFLVIGDPVLRTEDVEEAVASINTQSAIEEVYVAVTLSPRAADRFEEVTGANVNRRLAILVDGRITSAPVIRSKIGAGRVSITMGAGDFEQQREQAQNLAKGLSGR